VLYFVLSTKGISIKGKTCNGFYETKHDVWLPKQVMNNQNYI